MRPTKLRFERHMHGTAVEMLSHREIRLAIAAAILA